MKLTFIGPNGFYDLSLPSRGDGYEDQSIVAMGDGVVSEWHIAVEETGPDGAPILSGMTGDGTGLWFELRLWPSPQIEYWGDRVLIRTDQSAQ